MLKNVEIPTIVDIFKIYKQDKYNLVSSLCAIFPHLLTKEQKRLLVGKSPFFKQKSSKIVTIPYQNYLQLMELGYFEPASIISSDCHVWKDQAELVIAKKNKKRWKISIGIL